MGKVSRRIYCNPHKGWSYTEKVTFLNALKAYGPRDLPRLHAAVPTKTKLSIAKYVAYFTKKANMKLSKSYTSQGSAVTGIRPDHDKPTCPINQWLNALSHHANELKTVTSCALQLIAHLENHTHSDNEEDIDIKALYLFLAKALEGSADATVDGNNGSVLSSALVTLSTENKYSRRKEDVEFVQNINRLFPDAIKCASNSTENSEEFPKHLKEIQSLFAYNPLALNLPSLKSQKLL